MIKADGSNGVVVSVYGFSSRRHPPRPQERLPHAGSGPPRCECLRVQYDGRDRLLQNLYAETVTKRAGSNGDAVSR
eukprot:3238658-Prymnesium_polylepis.2